MRNWTLEDNVNDWVKSECARIKQTKYTVESAMSDYLKNAIQQGVNPLARIFIRALVIRARKSYIK